MNTVSYFEIYVENPERAIKFYNNVFNWKFIKDPNIPIDYWRIENAGPYGGMLARQSKVPAPDQRVNAFVCSVQVDNFDATAEKILSHRGQVAFPKFAVVGKCWQGYFLDTEGNTFGIFQVDTNAK